MCVMCDGPVHIVKSQLCKRCYGALWRAKNYTPKPKLTTLERFIAKIEKTENCWIWKASKNPKGYGSFAGTYAHRWSYENYKRPIPAGWQIDHLCKVTSCVNPDHLEPVTLEENLRRQHGDRYMNSICLYGHIKSWVNGRMRCYDCQSIRKKNKRHADAKK